MATDISLLAAYAEKYQRELIQLGVSFNELTEKCSVMAGIKDKETVTELRFKSLIKPYAKAWDPDSNKAQLIPRTIQVQVGQVELEEEPLKYRKTYLGNLMKNGVDPSDHPFEKEFLEGIMKRVNRDIVLEAAFFGEYDLRTTGTDTQKKSILAVTDGWLTIIDKEIALGNIATAKKNLIETGTITSANAVTKLKAFYRQAAAWYPDVRAEDMKMYISYNVYDAYCEHYQTLNGALPYNKEFEKIYLEGSARKCELVPMTGMKDSNRIILTHEENMLYGVDTLSDQEKVEVFNPGNPKVTGFLVLCAFGFQFASLNALFVNEADTEASGSASAAASGSPSGAASSGSPSGSV